MAPVLGFEPRLAVLETVVLTVNTTLIFGTCGWDCTNDLGLMRASPLPLC